MFIIFEYLTCALLLVPKVIVGRFPIGISALRNEEAN